MRIAAVDRKTTETAIELKLNLDGEGKRSVKTGVGFFDHMLELFAFHGRFDLEVLCQGDLHVDAHHTIEDLGILLGKAMDEALGDRQGIARYASNFIPMDETLCHTVLDVSGRPYHVFKASFATPAAGAFPTQMTGHFFETVAFNAKLTLHQNVSYGSNDHHLIEALFKGFGKACAEAFRIVDSRIPSSKGCLS